MSRPARRAVIPEGAWPARMSADLAAGYCGEKTVGTFLSRVGTEYPQPVKRIGRGRKVWLKADLDQAIGSTDEEPILEDAADVV